MATAVVLDTGERETYLNEEYGHQVVAPDRGPQAHRAAVLDVDHVLLLHRRFLRAADPPGTADPGRRPGPGRHLQQALHHARPGDGLLLPDPRRARRPRQLPHPDHDRGQGSCLPAHQPAQLVPLHHRRHADDLHDPQRRRRYRLDLLHSAQHRVPEDQRHHAQRSPSSSPASRPSSPA